MKAAAIFFPLALLSSPASAQEAIYIVRHAEQVQGTEDPNLTPAGQQRARSLAAFLRDVELTGVYSSQANRTRQTAAPTAEAMGKSVRQIPREDTAALVRSMQTEHPTGRVLVVAHSETIPQILSALGHRTPVKIEKGEYDNAFLVLPRKGAAPVVVRQRLALPSPSVFSGTLAEAGQDTAEVSTAELREVMKSRAAAILDARPPMEYAISHIPGALNVAPQRGRPAHLYISDVAEVERLVGGAKDKPLVLYCNGPFCGKTKRLGSELVNAGFRNVRRYQLGAPGWRALGGGAMETELSALPYIKGDKTAVWIDAREAPAFEGASIAGARNIPASGLRPGKDQGVMKAAKDDGRLPMDDHNTRIIVFGADGKDARAVADAIASEAFHNVSFVAAPVGEVRQVLR